MLQQPEISSGSWLTLTHKHAFSLTTVLFDNQIRLLDDILQHDTSHVSAVPVYVLCGVDSQSVTSSLFPALYVTLYNLDQLLQVFSTYRLLAGPGKFSPYSFVHQLRVPCE